MTELPIAQFFAGGDFMKSLFSIFCFSVIFFLSIFFIDIAQSETWETPLQTSLGEAYSGEWAHSIQQTSEGGFIAVGAITYSGTQDEYIWLTKTDFKGNINWEKTFGRTGAYSYGVSVQQTSDSGYIIVGETKIKTEIDDIYDIFLVKTDSAGNLMWSKTFGGEANEGACVVHETTDGYLIGGHTWSNDSSGYWLINLDKNGQ